MIILTFLYIGFGLACAINYYNYHSGEDLAPENTAAVITLLWLPIMILVLIDAVTDYMDEENDDDFTY